MTSANRNFLRMKIKLQFCLEKGPKWINEFFKLLPLGRDNHEIIGISRIML